MPLQPIYRLTLLLALAAGVGSTWAETAIYKAVDAQGRVMYANAPFKGATRVELPQLTVIPSTPSGSLGDAGKKSVVTAGVEAKSPEPPKAIAPTQGEDQTQAARASAAAPVVDPRPAGATNDERNPRVQQTRRDEVRRKMFEAELDTELNALSEVRDQLLVEQRRASAMRSMQASLGKKATPQSKQALERVFERVRALQDQADAHEDVVKYLRSQLAALSAAPSGVSTAHAAVPLRTDVGLGVR